jgi:DNA polymerase-3 subunit alpha
MFFSGGFYKVSFVHLHVHTCYSLLDGAAKIPDLFRQAKEQGMEALAVTDHGSMYGVIEFYKEAKKAGLKPIIGCEVYVAPRSYRDKVAGLDDGPYHLVLLAENQKGYKNLLKLVSLSWLEGFYYKPRVDKALLKQYSGGLIALSACLAGEVATLILQGKKEEAWETAIEYRDIFGKENFFLELQDHGLEEQRRVNTGLLNIAKETGIPLVATNDVHYLRQKDSYVQDILLCIQTGKSLQDQERMRFETDEFYLKSEDEMRLLFGDYPEALSNTGAIAKRCQVDFTFGKNCLPYYQVPEGYLADTYLTELCQKGLQKRYGVIGKDEQIRLDYELSIIKKMDYSSYFLIVWDFIRYAKEKGIFVGPGRGSAAGSIVSYCLEITDVDPMKYDLLFERFLNPERVSMPDIDIDFCFERRGEVIEYVVQKYGADHVAQIITFGTMAARAAIRDTGRAMGVPLPLVDRVAKLIPMELGVTISRALEVSPELVQMVERDSAVKELITVAKALEGIPRHAGTHAAGLVISPSPLDEYLPLQRTSEGLVSTQFDKDTVEEIGLLKIDLLGLRTLTVINNAVDIVKRSRGLELDLSTIPLNDEKTYNLLSEGDTIGVFQLESSGLRAILRDLKPKTFEDIIALVALYRPGPLGSGMIEDFVKRRHGEVTVKYLHPTLEPVLQTTYGVIIYQEQVMRIASELAGFSLGEADLLRRAMGKKKPEIIAGLRQQFIDGAKKKGIEAETAGKVFDLMEYFAGYGFNKSHSAAYALLAYQTAYLKAHHPVDFMAALLTSVMESKDRVPFYIEECRQMKIEILPPDVNESTEDFLVRGMKIRFGLAAIKQVGYQAIETIIEERKNGYFVSLQDFCERVNLSHINKRVIENLIKAGAFSSIPGSRAQLLEILHICIEQGLACQKEKNSNQLSLFDFTSLKTAINPPIPLPTARDFTEKEILQMEKDVLGIYISGHPLTEFKDIIEKTTTHRIEELPQGQDGKMVNLAGLIASVRRTITKRGETMAYFILEDLTGNVEALLFPKNMPKYNDVLKSDLPVLVKGRLNIQEDKPKIFVESIKALEDENKEELYLKIPLGFNEAIFEEELWPIVEGHPGETPLYLYFPETRKLILSEKRYWITITPDLLRKLEELLGKKTVYIMKK